MVTAAVPPSSRSRGAKAGSLLSHRTTAPLEAPGNAVKLEVTGTGRCTHARTRIWAPRTHRQPPCERRARQQRL